MRSRHFWTLLVCLFVAMTMQIAYAGEADDKKADAPDKKTEKQVQAKEPAKTDRQAKAEEPAKTKEPAKPAAPTYPEDARKIKVTIKLKNGKTISGVVKHFLVSENLVDHKDVGFTLSDGVTVAYETDEFSMSWDQIKKIEFNRKNKENGEISCYEDSDKSPDRLECTMTNQYVAYSKDKKKKGAHFIQDREQFRFAVKKGNKVINVDTHLGKIKITNERDETRKMKDLENELKDVFKGAVKSIVFH